MTAPARPWTPGPWHAWPHGVPSSIRNSGFGRAIATIDSAGLKTTRDRETANARLIAAAPDLFEALGPLAFSQEDNPPPGVALEDWRGAVLAARQARAKALGDTGEGSNG